MIKVIILAAGRGSRLGRLTEDRPKCMLEFGEETVLERQIRILEACGVCKENITVVVGYKKEYIAKRIQIHTVSNDEYQTTDNSYSLFLALQKIDEDVLVLDGDLVFTEEVVRRLLASPGNVLLGTQENGYYGATGISVDEQTGYVSGVGKHISTAIVYASMMKIVRADLRCIEEQLKLPGIKKTWYTVPINQLLKKINMNLLITTEQVCGINSYFEYIEAKRNFGIEDFSILVTGASGFLGKKIYHILKRNYSVEGIKGLSSSFPLVSIDLTDEAVVNAYFELKRPSVVIHTANMAEPDICERDRERAYKVNVEATRILMEACKKRNTKLIYISTDYVFGGESEKAYKHNSIRNPKNYYGITKCLAEDIVSMYENSLIVRIPIIYGYNDETDKVTFPIKVLNGLKKQQLMRYDNKQIRYPVLIDEVALAVEQALRKSGIVHISSMVPVTKYSWAKIIAKEFGYNEDLIQVDSKSDLADRPLHIHLEISERDFAVSNVIEGTQILKKQQNCVFKLIYKSNPVECIYGKVVGEYRYNLGRLLGRALSKTIVDKLDYIVPVPSSGLYYAMGVSESTGIPYLQALVKPDVLARSFQIADITLREQVIRTKILPIEGLIKGKKIALVDEAIFTGTTLRVVCDMVKACGVEEVYICLPTPVCWNKCQQYVQPDRELLSGYVDEKEIKDYFKVDGVFFQPYQNFEQSIGDIKNICFDCFFNRID